MRIGMAHQTCAEIGENVASKLFPMVDDYFPATLDANNFNQRLTWTQVKHEAGKTVLSFCDQRDRIDHCTFKTSAKLDDLIHKEDVEGLTNAFYMTSFKYILDSFSKFEDQRRKIESRI